MSTVAAVFATEVPWYTGVPTKLLKKTTLIPATTNHLPVYTLTFEIPKNATFTGRAKPHSEVRIDMGDVVKMVIPNYKPKSYSMSALRIDDNEFDITLKVYPNGRASGFLDRLQIGEEMNTFGISAKRTRQKGEYVGIVAYGVGMTEGLPIAKAELEKGDAKRVVLLWASRTWDDTFWKEDLASLTKQYPDQFEMVHILSREQRDGCLHGRVNPEVLQQVFQPTDSEKARFLSVGTKEMMRMTDGYFATNNYDMPKHHLIPKM
eukprot:CAMPEP_0194118714 /NCGR_PEP_ID=MMETSP0150-20130528/36738_1 /TAXON_ID=122233 /ORGANISM="Chaetoceros debilis, Strain MM31A-1" /LENGTH=262 /DNA_ID=CAMNT_0038810193 /DNA_START=90 /DNA_END=878 /DNA_ORIENTATION=-